MSKLFRPFSSKMLTNGFSSSKLSSVGSSSLIRPRYPSVSVNLQMRHFSGPQEPPDTRRPEDVDPDWWDGWHWARVIDDIEFEIQHYDPDWAIIPLEELQYDLKFAMKMYEWRSLEEPKYLTPGQAWEQGVIESEFAYIGGRMRAELDYRVIGGRGGVDTHEAFYGDGVLYGPFGTEEKPVLIPSRGRWRVVGCKGGYHGEDEHELAWIPVRQGPKHRCPLCGQIFQLWTTDASHHDHPYHDPKKDYEAELIRMLE